VTGTAACLAAGTTAVRFAAGWVLGRRPQHARSGDPGPVAHPSAITGGAGDVGRRGHPV